LSRCLSCEPVENSISTHNAIHLIDSLNYHSQNKSNSFAKKYLNQNRKDTDTIYEFCKEAENYFYYPNSSHRNDEIYYSIIKEINSFYKNRLRFKHFTNQLELLGRNRIYKKAENFTFTLKDGNKNQLYDIESPYIIIFFNNPDCQECKHVKRVLEENESINKFCKSKRITVLAIFPDEDLTIWKEAQYSDLWINAYDNGCKILRDNIYDLKASPTIYLLNKNKKVILKDTDIDKLINYVNTKL
jgi:hypothetical protein